MGEGAVIFFLFVIIEVCLVVKVIVDFSFLFCHEIKLSKFHKIIAIFITIIFSYFYFPSIYTLSLTSDRMLKFEPNIQPVDYMAYLWWFSFLTGAVLLGIKGIKKSGIMFIIARNIWLMILFICPFLLFILLNSIEKLNLLSSFWPWWDKYLLLADQQNIVEILFHLKSNDNETLVLYFLCYQMVAFIIFIITNTLYIRN